VSGGSINGEKRVLSITSTSYTFDATGISDQTATGTITHKLAPLEWSKIYSGTNLAAYKPDDVLATGCLLRVDDTGATSSRVVGYLTMSDVNTGTGPFPSAAQVSGGYHWTKSQDTSATARSWVIIGDSRGFFVHINNYAANNNSHTSHFGDFLSTKSPDPYACALAGQTVALGSASGGGNDVFYSHSSAVCQMYAARSFVGLGSPAQLRHAGFSPFNSADGNGSGVVGLTYPNQADNGLYVTPMTLSEVAGVYRGVFVGAYYCPMVLGTLFGQREKVTGVTGLPGRKLMALVFGATGGNGCGFVDITGPWTR
jgi:hypothetical protein